MTARTRTFAAVAAVLTLTLLGAACSSDSEGASDTTTTTADSGDEPVVTTTDQPETLTILVSNDDGVGAPGIDDVMVLAAMPDTEVIVAAPAENQSGSGSKTTEGELVATEATTTSGYPSVAVAGTPADSVNWALDGGITQTPQLVVTGINVGQNLGALADQVSGTVGAARAAVAHGIPALATSMGLSDDADYALGATYVVAWVEENREALLAGDMAGDVVVIQNMNIPHCATGEIRGEVEVTLAPTSVGAITEQNCESTVEAPADDITAFNNGFVTLSDLPPLAPAA